MWRCAERKNLRTNHTWDAFPILTWMEKEPVLSFSLREGLRKLSFVAALSHLCISISFSGYGTDLGNCFDSGCGSAENTRKHWEKKYLVCLSSTEHALLRAWKSNVIGFIIFVQGSWCKISECFRVSLGIWETLSAWPGDYKRNMNILFLKVLLGKTEHKLLREH